MGVERAFSRNGGAEGVPIYRSARVCVCVLCVCCVCGNYERSSSQVRRTQTESMVTSVTSVNPTPTRTPQLSITHTPFITYCLTYFVGPCTLLSRPSPMAMAISTAVSTPPHPCLHALQPYPPPPIFDIPPPPSPRMYHGLPKRPTLSKHPHSTVPHTIFPFVCSAAFLTTPSRLQPSTACATCARGSFKVRRPRYILKLSIATHVYTVI